MRGALFGPAPGDEAMQLHVRAAVGLPALRVARVEPLPGFEQREQPAIPLARGRPAAPLWRHAVHGSAARDGALHAGRAGALSIWPVGPVDRMQSELRQRLPQALAQPRGARPARGRPVRGGAGDDGPLLERGRALLESHVGGLQVQRLDTVVRLWFRQPALPRAQHRTAVRARRQAVQRRHARDGDLHAEGRGLPRFRVDRVGRMRPRLRRRADPQAAPGPPLPREWREDLPA
mmetsp:Transcript_13196/g.39599  ORF Transcript_13196/g.39599 Transcript_13196/m.39599 type:complete len:234 (-) Transcript_13196:20-721(-)